MQSANPTKPSFFDKHTSDIFAVSFGVLAIVVFLSVAFAWYDATSLPQSHRSIDAGGRGVIEQNENEPKTISQPAPIGDLIAAAIPQLQATRFSRSTPTPLLKTTFEFNSDSAANYSYSTTNLIASVVPNVPDNSMWRYTTDGWQDISTMVNQSQSPKPLLEGVHPITWTALLLLASMLLLVMASSDREIKRLLVRSNGQ